MTPQQLSGAAQSASRKWASASSELRTECVLALAAGIDSARDVILRENQLDLTEGRSAGLSPALLDRLLLDDSRLDAMIEGIKHVAKLPDILGQKLRTYEHPSGMSIESVRVPIGVVLMIYESRPNVSSDSAALCLKTGNAVILRGGKEARRSNLAIVNAMSGAAASSGLPEGTLSFVEDQRREYLAELLAAQDRIDLVIPRGGEGLIRAVSEQSKIPVIKHYKGVCHIYVDQSADLGKAVEIIVNAKCQRPGVCNAAETLLVHQDVAEQFLPIAAQRLLDAGVELRGDTTTCQILPQAKPATEDDWFAEYLDLILAVRVIPSLEGAVEHINTYGSHHSDAIVAESASAQDYFLKAVDSAAVYANASTRFTDGAEFGLGAEIGISTDKLHARGPMGLEGLTTYKYCIRGNGEIRS